MTTKKTYNFIEAVNSGKRFQFESCDEFWIGIAKPFCNRADECLCAIYDDGRNEMFEIDIETVNARFTLEEKTITITESEFEKMWLDREYGRLELVEFKKELGF